METLMLSFPEVDSAIQVQILIKAVCISHSANTFEKAMNPTILSQAIGK